MATATKKKKAKARPKRLRQQHLPTMEPPSHPVLDKLTYEYVEARDARMEMGREEVHKRTLLELKMKELNLPAYETPDGLVASFKAKTKLTVTRKSDGGEESDDDFDARNGEE